MSIHPNPCEHQHTLISSLIDFFYRTNGELLVQGVHCVVAELVVIHPRPELTCPLGVTFVYLDLTFGDVLGIRYAFLVCENLERKSGVEILP